MNFQLEQAKQALIFGAGHGIGLGFTEELLERHPQIQVVATYRKKELAENLLALADSYPTRLKVYQLDPTQERELQELASTLRGQSFDLVINSVGLLHHQHIQPEKSLRSFDPEVFLEVVRVNATVTPLIAKHFEGLLNKETVSVLAGLSAKVGSIEDNRLGGWYSYRASKAALNMLIKTLSIEWARKKSKCVVLALHPGTTETPLSAPFTERTSYQVHSVRETAANLLGVIDGLGPEDSGRFLSWDGSEIDW